MTVNVKSRAVGAMDWFVTIAFALANIVLTFLPWVGLILLPEALRTPSTLIAIAISVVAAFGTRLWFASVQFPVQPNWLRAIGSLLPCLLIVAFTASVSLAMASVLFVFSFAAWSIFWLRGYLALRGARDTASAALTDMQLTGALERVFQRVSLGWSFQPLETFAQKTRWGVLFDMACFVPAVATILLWPQSASLVAAIILVLAAVTLWSHLDVLASLLHDQALARRDAQSYALSYTSHSMMEFGSVTFEELSNKTVRNFSADVIGGLCLAFVGAGGSGKTEFLRDLASGALTGRVTFNSRNSVAPKDLSELFEYCPAEGIWPPGSINNALFDSGPRKDKAASIVRALDPFGDVLPSSMDPDITRVFVTPLQAKMIGLAQCLSSDAPILVITNPEMHLDQVSKAAFISVALRAKLDGKILIIATEDDMLMSIADELVMLDQGEVIDRGPMAEVRERHRDKFLRATFKPTAEDAYRLSLWLQSIMPSDVGEELSSRVIGCAEELLLQAPRDGFAINKPVIFDTKLGAQTCQLTMLDWGDLIGFQHPSAPNDEGIELFTRVLPITRRLADHVGESQRHGYRQISTVFKAQTHSLVSESEDQGQFGKRISA